MTRSAVDALVQRLWPDQETQRESLPGGITNTNILVSVGEERFVLRLAGENSELLGIDRDVEVAASELAASLGIAPALFAHSSAEGWMVSRFLAGRTVTGDELADESMVHTLASTLRRLHDGGSVDAFFNPFDVIERYHEVARSRSVPEPFDYEGATRTLRRISEARPFRATALCHNDLLNGNLLFDGQVRILDWEYAGMGDPFFDLANLSAHHHFTSSTDRLLLTSYVGAVEESALAVLELMKVVSELREAMWGVVQRAISSLDVDFGAYAEEHGARYDALVDAMDLEDTLRAASRHDSSFERE